MKKLIASSALLMSAGLALPALAQMDASSSSLADVSSSSSPADTASSDGLNDPDLFGDPEDDGLDVTSSSDASVSSAAADAESSASVLGTTDSEDVTDEDGSAAVPTALPDTGGGGMAK